MHRLTICSVAVALAAALGCGKKGPGAPTDKPGAPKAGKGPDFRALSLAPKKKFDSGMKTAWGSTPETFVSPDGSRLALRTGVEGGGTMFQVWDVSGEPKKLREAKEWVGHVSPDLKTYNRASESSLLDLDTGKESRPIKQYARYLTPKLLYTRDYTKGEAGRGEFVVKGIDADTGEATELFRIPARKGSLHDSPARQKGEVFFGFENDAHVEVWNLASKTKAREVTLAEPLLSNPRPNVSEDGKWYTATVKGGRTVFDGTTGAVVMRVPGIDSHFVRGTDLVGGGQDLDGKVGTALYDVNTKQPVAYLAALPFSIGATKDGKTVYALSKDGEVSVWDLSAVVR